MSGDSSGYQSSTVCSSPPTTHSESDETMSADGQVDEDLQCPVCRKTFEDPYLVCPNYHNLCLRCYQRLVSRANHETPLCPECRQELTHPKENKHLRGLIEIKRESRQRVSQTEQLKCQHSECSECTCIGRMNLHSSDFSSPVPTDCPLNKSSNCERLASIRCGHCKKYLCEVHFSTHRLALEVVFNRQLMASAAFESHRAFVTEWEQLTKCVISQTELLLQCLFHTITAQYGMSMFNVASLSLRTFGISTAHDAASLRAALDADDVQAAQAASENLKAKLPRSYFSTRPIAQPPSREMMFQLVKQQLPRMLNKLELRPQDADSSDAWADESGNRTARDRDLQYIQISDNESD